jgi:hypothetical protein
MCCLAQKRRCEESDYAMNDLAFLDQKGFKGKLLKELHRAFGPVGFRTGNCAIERIRNESRQVHRRQSRIHFARLLCL